MTTNSDTLTMALALGRHGFAVFFCRGDKRPATPGSHGNGGFHFASTDPTAIRALWRDYPGELIGVRTGEASGRSVLDVDHPQGWPWFRDNKHRLPPTRTFQTRGLGAHLWMRHTPGLRCSQSLIAPGIDVRAEGGYAIYWVAAGLPVIDPAQEAPWPDWLKELASPKPLPPLRLDPPPTEQTAQADQFRVDAFARKLLANVAAAPMGRKHEVLLKSARSLGGVIVQLGWGEATAVRYLLAALPRSGPNRCLDWKNAAATARAGVQHGARNPISLADRPYGRKAAE